MFPLEIVIDQTRKIIIAEYLTDYTMATYMYTVKVPHHLTESGREYDTLMDCILGAYEKIIELDGLPFWNT